MLSTTYIKTLDLQTRQEMIFTDVGSLEEINYLINKYAKNKVHSSLDKMATSVETGVCSA